MDRRHEDVGLFVFVVVGVLFVVGLFVFTVVRDHIGFTKVLSDDATENCEENMPCWNCETMGNKICGVNE